MTTKREQLLELARECDGIEGLGSAVIADRLRAILGYDPDLDRKERDLVRVEGATDVEIVGAPNVASLRAAPDPGYLGSARWPAPRERTYELYVDPEAILTIHRFGWPQGALWSFQCVEGVRLTSSPNAKERLRVFLRGEDLEAAGVVL